MALRNDDHSSADATVNMASEGEKNPQGSTATHEDVFANNPFFTDPAKVKTTTRRLQNLLSHLNAKDVKELFKCSVALWIITVFIVIDPILKAEGQALFFGCMVLLLAPPSGIVFIQLLISATVILGMSLAWGFGVITMKAALAARPQADTNARLAELQQAASRNTTNVQQASGQASYAQVLVFEGFMLDARVTAVYYAMICFFIYFLARMRVTNPKLIAVQIFATVVSDVFLTTGPLLPSFNGVLPQVLIKPAATGVAVGLACNILLFPESTSHIVLDNINQILSPMTGFVDACRISLDHSAKPITLSSLRKAKSQGVAAFKALEARLAFLPLDISVCRWNTEDIMLLKKPLRLVFITWIGLLETQISRTTSRDRLDKLDEHVRATREAKERTERPKIGHHQLAQQLDFAQLFRNTETEELIVKSMAALQTSADPLLRNCNAALEAIVETISLVNGRKWFGRPTAEVYKSMHDRHDEILQSLRRESDIFLAATSARILDPHAHLFNKDGILDPPASHGVAPLRGVVLGLILEERIVSFARALTHLLTQVVALERERTKQRLWLPKNLRNFGSWVFGRQPVPQVTPVIPEMKEEVNHQKPKTHRRHGKKGKSAEAGGSEDVHISPADQLASIHIQRGKTRNRFGRTILLVSHWLSNTAGIYALQVVVVTIALSIPGAIPSSAGFYYRERGLWALIMGQLGLVPYAADFFWGLVTRVIGTIIGGVLGMVAWYIGAGSGPGNPYGIAAIMAPLCIVFMYFRLFGSPALLQAVILTAVTAYLTMAYSWVDTHIPSYGNPGVGYAVFWRRVLLVLVGYTACAIVTYFPRPQSASRHYRKVLSQTLSSFQDRYALLIKEMTSNTNQKLRGEQGNDDNNQLRPQPTIRNIVSSSPLLTGLEKATITTGDTLSSILGPIQLLKFEFSSTDFTASGLSRITMLATNINFDIFQLFYYSAQLSPAFKKRFLLLSGAFEEKFVGDFMSVLSLLSHSLESGDALPSVLCAPLMVRAFKERVLGVLGANQNWNSLNNHGDDANDHAHFSKILGPVTRQALDEDEDGFRKYCVVLSAMVGLLNAIDEIVLVVKEQLGETHIVDVEHWGSSAYSRGDALDDERTGLLVNGDHDRDHDRDDGRDLTARDLQAVETSKELDEKNI